MFCVGRPGQHYWGERCHGNSGSRHLGEKWDQDGGIRLDCSHLNSARPSLPLVTVCCSGQHGETHQQQDFFRLKLFRMSSRQSDLLVLSVRGNARTWRSSWVWCWDRTPSTWRRPLGSARPLSARERVDASAKIQIAPPTSTSQRPPRWRRRRRERWADGINTNPCLEDV